jgi:hypothetical protein
MWSGRLNIDAQFSSTKLLSGSDIYCTKPVFAIGQKSFSVSTYPEATSCQRSWLNQLRSP